MTAAPRSRLLPNIAANLGGQFILLVLGVVAVKLVYGRLGQDALGIVLFVQTLNLVLAGVLDLGVSSVTVREVAAHADDDAGYVRGLVRTASSLYWVVFALVAVALLLAAPWIVTHWLRLHVMDPATATGVIRLLGVAALTALPRALYTSLFRGLQRMTLSNGIDVATGLLQQVGTVVILARGGGLSLVVTWLAVGYVAAIIADVLVLRLFLGWSSLIPGWSASAVRRNLWFSAHMTFISAVGAILTYLDKLVVSALLPIATLGSYAFTSSLIARGAVVSTAVADAAYPSMSSLAHRDRPALLAQYRTLQELVCFLTVPVFAGLALLSLPLLRAVFGATVAQTLLFPAVALCVGYYLNGTLMIPYLHSLAVGKPEITSHLSAMALIVVVPVTIGSVMAVGVTGAAFGYLAYKVFFYLVGVPRYCRECLRIPVLSWYGPVVRAVVLGVATYGVAAAVLALLKQVEWPAVSGAVIVASVVFALAAYRLVDPALREAVKNLRRGKAPWVIARAA